MSPAFLQIIAGARQGLNVPLSEDKPLVVGRKHGDLRLSDPLVSSRHCRFIYKDGGYVVQDLDSTNGTMVNDKLVHEARLEPGTQITIGSCRLVLFVGEEEERGTQDQASAEQAPKLEVAWLLDEELVEFRGVDDHTRPPSDVIGQDLRLPPGVNAMIEVISGQDVGKLFRFTKGNVAVGRRCGEVPLTDVEVSRRHSVVEVFGREMVFLRDLGSTNGTYHNGRRVSIARLQDGDTIGCGKTVMKIKLPN